MGIERTLLFLALALLAEIAGTLGGFGSSVFFVPIANMFFDFESGKCQGCFIVSYLSDALYCN